MIIDVILKIIEVAQKSDSPLSLALYTGAGLVFLYVAIVGTDLANKDKVLAPWTRALCGFIAVVLLSVRLVPLDELSRILKPGNPEAVVQLARDFNGGNADWEPHTETKNGMEMALVPKGCFSMGSNDGNSNERPVHEVCFDQPFWLDKTEVTRAMYQQCVAAGACTAPPASDASTAPDQPVNRVTWFEADAYCQWRDARLPTEAEWEYAARGPNGLIYPWGNAFVGANVVYSDNSGSHTAVVGSRPAGASWVGALDMSGNVWEWVADWYGDYSGERQVNPRGPDSGQIRVLRGGSFLNSTYYLRAAIRDGDFPNDEDNLLGFRCARSQ